jgi:hypothetical protein
MPICRVNALKWVPARQCARQSRRFGSYSPRARATRTRRPPECDFGESLRQQFPCFAIRLSHAISAAAASSSVASVVRGYLTKTRPRRTAQPWVLLRLNQWRSRWEPQARLRHRRGRGSAAHPRTQPDPKAKQAMREVGPRTGRATYRPSHPHHAVGDPPACQRSLRFALPRHGLRLPREPLTALTQKAG